MKFSLLMSIYHKESYLYFHRAMQSIWDEQVNSIDNIEFKKLSIALSEYLESKFPAKASFEQ